MGDRVQGNKMNEELNEKLAKWVGFQKFGWENWDMWAKPDEAIPESWTVEDLYPNSFALPKFTDSLDAIFKWLVPKLIIDGDYPNLREIVFDPNPDGTYWTQLAYLTLHDDGCIETEQAIIKSCDYPALALCRAISKLIESEVV